VALRALAQVATSVVELAVHLAAQEDHGRDHGWAPYTWLFYFCFFLLNPILNHAGWKQWLATGLGTIAFLVIYFSFFWIKCPWNLLNLAAFMILGAGFAPFNEGSCTFFVFAAAFSPYAVETESAALKLLVAVLAVAAGEWWLLHLSGWFLFYGGGLAMVVGGSNIYFAQRERSNNRLQKAQEEIEHYSEIFLLDASAAGQSARKPLFQPVPSSWIEMETRAASLLRQRTGVDVNGHVLKLTAWGRQAYAVIGGRGQEASS